MSRVLAVVVGMVLLATTSCAREGGSARSEQGTGGQSTNSNSEARLWTTHTNEAHGVEVTYPSDWYRAESRLTPNLGDPLEILSLGTYPLRVSEDRCTHYPVKALEDFGSDDAFISVLERAAPNLEHYLPRPSRFELPSDSETGRFCVPSDERLDEWLFFSDAGRGFILLVALGESASEETRADLLRILNSLRFDEDG